MAKKYEKELKILSDKYIITDDFDEKYLKLKFISNYDLALKKVLISIVIILVVGSTFNEGNKYYPQVFLVN